MPLNLIWVRFPSLTCYSVTWFRNKNIRTSIDTKGNIYDRNRLCEAHPSITSHPGDVCRCQPITGLQSRLTHLSQSASPTQTRTWQHYNIDILLLHIAYAGQVFSLLYMCNRMPSRWGNKMGKKNKVYDAASADENDKRLGKLCWYAWLSWLCRYVYITYLITVDQYWRTDQCWPGV